MSHGTYLAAPAQQQLHVHFLSPACCSWNPSQPAYQYVTPRNTMQHPREMHQLCPCWLPSFFAKQRVPSSVTSVKDKRRLRLNLDSAQVFSFRRNLAQHRLASRSAFSHWSRQRKGAFGFWETCLKPFQMQVRLGLLDSPTQQPL